MRVPAELVIVQDTVILQKCALYKDHFCAVVNAHHICPKSWFEAAGVLVVTPMITLCPVCHMNVHAAIDGKIKGQDVSMIPPRCRSLAAQAFDLATMNNLTPGLTL
jgi:hypothetical protein